MNSLLCLLCAVSRDYVDKREEARQAREERYVFSAHFTALSLVSSKHSHAVLCAYSALVQIFI